MSEHLTGSLLTLFRWTSTLDEVKKRLDIATKEQTRQFYDMFNISNIIVEDAVLTRQEK